MIMAPAGYDSIRDVSIGSTESALIDVWRSMEPRMRRVAQRFAEDEDQADDLVQEALIELWLIDPSRFVLDDPRDAAYLRRMLVRRMWDVRRADAHRGYDRSSATDSGADGAAS
jgi:DNA-directed RNA polymerase specialized sigma24 family protein